MSEFDNRPISHDGIKEEHDADIHEERAARVMRWPRWGCFFMVAGILVPPFLWAFVPRSEEVEGAFLYLIGLFFALLFFVGLAMLVVGWLKANRLQARSEPPRSR